MSVLPNFPELFSEEACQCHIDQLCRQNKCLQCPRCQSRNVRPWGKYHRKPGLYHYLCNTCGRTFNDLTATSFERRRLSLPGWILAAFLLARCCPSRRVARELGGSLCSTYHRLWVLRNPALSLEQRRKLEETVDADEIYQTTGSKGQSSNGGPKALEPAPRKRRLKKGRGRGKDTPCMIAWVARPGKVVLRMVRDFSRKTVQDVALQAVTGGGRICTDSAGSYESLTEIGFLHERVNHSQRK